MPALDSLYRERAALWAPVYHNRETQLGATATLINFGDQEVAGKVTATTFAGRKFSATGLSPTWTPSSGGSSTALSGWATAFNLANLDNWLGAAPILTFTPASSEDVSTPDAAYWTRATAVFSVGAWINVTADTNTKSILAKYDITTGAELREWSTYVDSGELLGFEVWDETANTYIGRSYSVALANRWYHVVFTYSGGTTSAGCKIYLDGAQVDDGNVESGVFTSMQDTATLPRLGASVLATGTRGGFFNGKMLGGPFCPFFVQAELTIAQIQNLYYNERHSLGV